MDDATISAPVADPVASVRLVSYAIESGEVPPGGSPSGVLLFAWFRQGGDVAFMDRLVVRDGETPETKWLSGTGSGSQPVGLVVAVDTALPGESGTVLARLRKRATAWARANWLAIAGVDRFAGTA